MSLEEGQLPRSVRTGIVSLIYKKGDAEDLKNRSPITLCNVDYKILTSVVKTRIISHMPDLIGSYQTCNIKGRSILDNLNFFREHFKDKFDGAVLSLDQEAAFDRVNRNFMFSVMKKCNFPPSILSAIKLVHNNGRVTVKFGVNLTDFIAVYVGVKQGDPVSSLLYVLSFEPFLRHVNQALSPSTTLNPVPVVNVAAYAADCQISYQDTERL